MNGRSSTVQPANTSRQLDAAEKSFSRERLKHRSWLSSIRVLG
jgi:hypothetical protein